ncbi:MAG: hypothetical protein BJ554DRAFT_6138 [Olpidium bornovanus]|uniref:RRM domain-containing protein n=1 Tax=Olpidium bornovanus TaxID=278681 RepID=A0A8H7ZY89_9FUNG|nr:MAG: hypothetical protein BJ554DRAFT_6138 [Olpidium bornovanus]
MDRLDMSLDDIIMHDRNRKEKKNRNFRNQPQKANAASRAQHQNNHAPRGGAGAPGAGGGGGGGGGGGAVQRKGGQVGHVVVLGNNSGAGKTRVVTASQRSRILPYARPNAANGTGRPTEIWTRKAVDAGSVRVLGVPQTGLVTTHSLQRSTRNVVSAGNRNRQVVVEPLVRQPRVVAAPPVALSPQPISIRGVAGPVTVVLSHLDANTTADDIRLVSKQVGAVHKVTLLYDSAGKSTGTAEIVYANREAALAAVKRFDNVVADGKMTVAV